ncbi:MAG: hypothetical protein IPN25_05815 [Sphingobacteriales bacterium]|jgi:hypothetical protein|nr:hypothetical protein [Sphingobacteriales bacterium]
MTITELEVNQAAQIKANYLPTGIYTISFTHQQQVAVGKGVVISKK